MTASASWKGGSPRTIFRGKNLQKIGNVSEKSWNLLQKGRLEGAMIKGKTWLIPSETKSLRIQEELKKRRNRGRKMGTSIEPIIRKLDDNSIALQDFQDELWKNATDKERDILLQFPTVYIHNWKDTDDYEVYIGESNNVIQRTKQHYDNCGDESKWQSQLKKHNAALYVIGHEHFNKSLTLDIENRLMLYLMSVDRVKKIHNMRGNPQNRYYPDSELDDIFRMMWKRLRRYDKELFPKESAIKDSAVFKASPLHKLTADQESIKDIIISRVMDALQSGKKNQIIFIEGEAGTGKTVLNSSTFYEIYSKAEENEKDISCFMMVNHDEQITVYSQIAQKLGLTDKYGEVVCKPTSFINKHNSDEPVDVAFIDEAHLLLTQGKQSYQGDNQLQDIIDRARVTVVMFDENQILTTDQYWEAQVLDKFRNQAKRTLSDGTKKKFGAELTQHEVRILMTRGVEGLYIYACDDELREALKKSAI